MTQWSLETLLNELSKGVEERLAAARRTLGHPEAKGTASEGVWLDVLKTYLPKRYQVEKAYVVDSEGTFSQQLDVVIFDRQYSPLIFHLEGQTVLPAESVYASFEAKQTIDLDHVRYAAEKVQSVRCLKRTSLPVPHVSGTAPPKPLHHILGGLLTLESGWTPPMGASLEQALKAHTGLQRLDLGCVAAHGLYSCRADGGASITPKAAAGAAYVLELIARLQECATVPMIDIRAYARFLK